MQSNGTTYCTDGLVEDSGWSLTGGWPPPCVDLKMKYFIVDSTSYWSLAESMGVASGRGAIHLIVADLKVQ